MQAVGRILQLRLRALQHLEHRAQAGVVARQLVQRIDGLAGQAVGRRLAVGQRGQRRTHAIEQRLRMGQALVLGIQLVPFVVARGELVDLADLPGQAFALALQRLAACAGIGQRRFGRLPGLPQRGQPGGVGAGLLVEQRAHRGRPRQALPGMLAVDVDQLLAGLAQLAHGGRAAVDPGAALALGIDAAAQQQRVACAVEAGLVQPAGQRRRRVELGRDLGARAAFAHQRGVAAAAQGQLQRVDQDRLACAGLAGQHREAGLQLHLELADDDHVAKRQAAQHLNPGRR